MMCFHPITLSSKQVVPCGNCIGCRINRTSAWTLRLLAEQTQWKDCAFVTLTYDDEHLPTNSSLVKADVQKFFKRLRKALGDRKIKYYCCGEYGEKTDRPHYHAIIFGLSCSNSDRQLVADCWKYCNRVKFTDRRCKGIASVSKDSIQYVAGYCQKKLTGVLGLEAYECTNRVPPFSLSSRGLGLEYFKTHDVFDENLTATLWNGKHFLAPRYIRDKLGLELSMNDKAVRYYEDLSEVLDKEQYHKACRLGLLSELQRQLKEEDVENALRHYYAKNTIKRS